MTLLESLTVDGLFGYVNHRINFRRTPVTVLTGPNASGKTHLLKIPYAIITLDIPTLAELSFQRACLTYRNGDELTVHKSETNSMLYFSAISGYGVEMGACRVSLQWEVDDRTLPPWIEQVSDGRWMDFETGELLGYRDVMRITRKLTAFDIEANLEWLDRFTPESGVVLIETSRLNLTPRSTRERGYQVVRTGRKKEPKASAIEKYVARISQQMSSAKRESLVISQQSDRQFAPRALDQARETIKESDLRARFLELSDLHRQLTTTGLIQESIDLTVPSRRLNPTERRIINVFLEDWRAKLEPLLPVHRRIQLLKELVGSKIIDKEMLVQPDGGIVFESPAGSVPVTALSSGEQHLLALLTMLLFSAKTGSLVLIDEPEISLHAAWKHAFIPDLERIAEINETQVVLATHSSALINARWDLVEEIHVQ